MDTENLQFLQTNLKQLGFGDKLNNTLQEKMKAGAPEFSIRATEYYNRPDSAKDDISTKDKVQYELDFKKGKGDDGRYFLNSYTAALEKNGQLNEHKFYVDKGRGMTRKESYNLLDGRPVYKELKNKDGEKYNAWIKLDPERNRNAPNKPYLSYSDNYGYSPAAAVAKLPIKELNDPAAIKIILDSLRKGNITPVTYVKNGNEEPMVAVANPQFKSVDLYGLDGKKLFVGNEKKTGFETVANQHIAAAPIAAEQENRPTGIKR